MELSVFSPLIAFAILLAASVILYAAMKVFGGTKRPKGSRGMGPYSCGEQLPTHMIQPDYGQFYPFAFFFTVLHVVALTATTVPAVSLSTIIIAGIYVVGAVAGLTILYRK
jgi:NADH-quinone oxidoreductase subunit A